MEDDIRPSPAMADDTPAATEPAGPLLRSARAIGIGLPVLLAGVAMVAYWPDGGTNGAKPGVPTAKAAPVTVPTPAIEVAADETSALKIMEIDEESAAELNATRPFDGKPEIPAAFRFAAGADDRVRATDCLAAAAFYEAGGDREGQRAVAQVVLNRVRHPAYPKTVCEVVFEGAERQTGCQFTFTCDGALRRRPSEAQWRAAQKVASEALAGSVDKSVGTATHYHADYVVPYWSPNLQKIAQVGPHIFYRWPGGFGSRRVFRDQGKREEPQIAKLAWLSNHRAMDDLEAPTGPEPQSFAEMVGSLPPSQAGQAAGQRIVLGLDMKQPSGRWAMTALDSCGGRADCQVVGYPAGRAAEGRPAFLYTRDGNSGLDRALWDCRTVTRPSADQCLPEDDAALRHLMRDRSRLAAR
jgi:spore germination cell wall hydrolase CwlJ-like protein